MVALQRASLFLKRGFSTMSVFGNARKLLPNKFAFNHWVTIPTTKLIDNQTLGFGSFNGFRPQIRSFATGISFERNAFCRIKKIKEGDIVEIPLPPLAESLEKGILATWEKAVGEYCAEDEVIAIVDTDKVSIDVRSHVGGELTETLAQEGDDIEVGQVIAKIKVKAAPEGTTSEHEEKPKEEAQPPASPEKISKPEPQPVAQPKAVPQPSPPSPKPTPAPSTHPQVETGPSVSGTRGQRVVKMTPMRKTIAARLKEAQNTAASLTTFNEIDMSKVMAMRNRHKEKFLEKHGVKLGFMSAFVAAATKALMELPTVNASIQDDHIVYHDYVDISIAVSSPRGLVVPVLRNCEQMNFADIERNIAELGKKAKDNTLTLEEMAGGTFTITNGGVFGSMMSTPMINLPQSAILGMHNIVQRPVVVNGEIVVRPVMYVALTYDHRLIDGRESVTFLKSIKEKVEDPERLLLDL